MMTTFLSLIKIMFALVIVCYSWSSSASALPGSPLASNSSQLNGASPQPLPGLPPIALKSAFSRGHPSDDFFCVECRKMTEGILCVDDKCYCPLGFKLRDGPVPGLQVCTQERCSDDRGCKNWTNTQCNNDHKCVCSPGYRLEKKIRCQEVPTEPPSTTTSTTTSTTPRTTRSTTSSTSWTASSNGCKPRDCSDDCRSNSVCTKIDSMCKCRCPIGFLSRFESGHAGLIVNCYQYRCGQDIDCENHYRNTYCIRDEHMCLCKQGFEPDPEDTSILPPCRRIPGWTTETAAKMSTSTDVSAKVATFLWKICLWIIGIVVVIFLVAMCITIVVCCYCCKSDKSKQTRYNNKSNAPMAPSKYPPMVGYPTPSSSDNGKGGPILVSIPGTSGLKASKVVGGSKVPNPPMALYSGPGGYPQANLVAVPGPIASKDSKTVPSNGS